jgi:hypothetical protein
LPSAEVAESDRAQAVEKIIAVDQLNGAAIDFGGAFVDFFAPICVDFRIGTAGLFSFVQTLLNDCEFVPGGEGGGGIALASIGIWWVMVMGKG